MDTLIHSFFPKATHKTILHDGPNLWVKHCQIRPFGSSFVIKGTGIEYIPTNTVVAQSIQIWYASIAALARSIRYTIHSAIEIESVTLRIAGIPIHFRGIRIVFPSSSTRVHITVDSVTFGSLLVVQRFHNDTHPGIQVTIQADQSVHIQIPEIRILSWIPMSMLQSIRSDVQRMLPKAEGNEPMPVIHVSSIFVRYVPLGWHRCISPISIGGSYKSIWEIWEHIVRALTRI